jgi:hypothetical protein
VINLRYQQIRNRINLLGGKCKFNYQGTYDGRKQTLAVIKVGGKYYHATAECSLKDQFNKKIGRAIALGRAWELAETKQNHSIELLRQSSPMMLFKEDR